MRELETEVESASIVWVAVSGQGLLGAMAVADVLREDAIQTVRQLQGLGLRVVLMSGDRPQVPVYHFDAIVSWQTRGSNSYQSSL